MGWNEHNGRTGIGTPTHLAPGGHLAGTTHCDYIILYWLMAVDSGLVVRVRCACTPREEIFPLTIPFLSVYQSRGAASETVQVLVDCSA